MGWHGALTLAWSVTKPCNELGLDFETKLTIYRSLVEELRSQGGSPFSHHFPTDVAWAVATSSLESAHELGAEEASQGEPPAWAFRQLRAMGHELWESYSRGYSSIPRQEIRRSLERNIRHRMEYYRDHPLSKYSPFQVAMPLRTYLELEVSVPKDYHAWVLKQIQLQGKDPEWAGLHDIQALLAAEEAGSIYPAKIF